MRTGPARTMSKFQPFQQALAVAQSLGLTNKFEWEQWCKEGMRPSNVPSHPNATYKEGGWQGWVGALARQQPHQEDEQVCAVR